MMAEEDTNNRVKERWRRTDITVAGKYVGTVDGRLTDESMDKLLDGLKLDGFKIVEAGSRDV
jgi:hypothetical protein